MLVQDAAEMRIAVCKILESLVMVSREGHPVALGVDAEWVPREMLAQGAEEQRVCVLQIASRDLAIIIDLCSWVKHHGDDAEELLEETLGPLLLRSDILKLGFGIAVDVKMLRESFPNVPCFEVFQTQCAQQVGYIDIQDMVLARDKQLPRTERLGVNCGLSSTCMAVLGQALCKQQQTSNWAERPLSAEQVLYAATDSQSLVRVYEHLGPKLAGEARLLSFKRQAQQGKKVAKHSLYSASSSSASSSSTFPWRRFKAEQSAKGTQGGEGGGGSQMSQGYTREVGDDMDKYLQSLVGQPVGGRFARTPITRMRTYAHAHACTQTRVHTRVHTRRT